MRSEALDGCIYLPVVYVNGTSEKGRRCTRDVKSQTENLIRFKPVGKILAGHGLMPQAYELGHLPFPSRHPPTCPAPLNFVVSKVR